MLTSPKTVCRSTVEANLGLDTPPLVPETARCRRQATMTPPDLCWAEPSAAEAMKTYPAFFINVRKFAACTSDDLVSCRKMRSSVACCRYFLQDAHEVTLAVTRLTVLRWLPPPRSARGLGTRPPWRVRAFDRGGFGDRRCAFLAFLYLSTFRRRSTGFIC